MANNTEPANSSTVKNDAATNALAREQAVAPGEIPVKQHNPGDKGINPDQRGPAQPSGSDDAAPGTGT